MTNTLNRSIADIEIPERMRKLPINEKGFPVPWFVAEMPGGGWDFRVVGPGKIAAAHNYQKCWLCGEKMGVHKCFVIGPMCVVNRISSEPPSHFDCAQYAARACPFLTQPKMRRNEVDLPPEGRDMPGVAIKRNPGATALYITKGYKLMKVDHGVLFRMNDPLRVEWFAHGRTATRAEVEHSIDTGLPLLYAEARKDGPEGVTELERYIERAQSLLPAGA